MRPAAPWVELELGRFVVAGGACLCFEVLGRGSYSRVYWALIDNLV